MISRYQNNKSKRDIFILFAISFAIMFMIMSLMHVLKYRLFADITKWESDLISIIISSVMAVLIALFIFRNQQKYHSQLLREIEKREKLEKEIGESLSIIDAAFDATEDGILIVSREGKVSKSNKKFL